MTFPIDTNAYAAARWVRLDKPNIVPKNTLEKRFPKKKTAENSKAAPVLTSPARIEYLKYLRKHGFKIEFRYPLWDYWVEIDDPLWLSYVYYRPIGKRAGDVFTRPPEKYSHLDHIYD